MRRAVLRRRVLTQQVVTDVLGEINLVAMPASLFREASQLPGTHLRSLDALHLAAAVRTGADYLVTYDTRLADSRQLGLRFLAPA